ncbi:SDR family NAD(P)-dependent oxidoreductase [Chitinophaga sp. NPDC101104]|uniref:SDR family NAD(P)-dependent oxidoreductase n=1 Tax=Chitinophaga sp. NPDC101104 TaxID=3390561 RepID=UPI003CFDACCB
MKNELNPSGRGYALVTGGTSGIGYELAKLLCQDGYNLILVARSGQRLEEVCNEFRTQGVTAIPLEADLFRPEAAKEVYETVRAQNLPVSILVNNAGQGERGPFCQVPLQRHLDIIQLNITSVVTLTRLIACDMVERGEGRILNLASIVSKSPAPDFSVYAASKAFVLSFSQALSVELEGTGVSVTALVPGRTDTDFFFKAHMDDSKEYQEHSLADPAEVAADGYDALVKGESRVVSGAQTKMMMGMMNAKHDEANAETMHENMQPTDKPVNEWRTHSSHDASQRERELIGNEQGDMR